MEFAAHQLLTKVHFRNLRFSVRAFSVFGGPMLFHFGATRTCRELPGPTKCETQSRRIPSKSDQNDYHSSFALFRVFERISPFSCSRIVCALKAT